MQRVIASPRGQLYVLAGGVVAAMSPWFATSAVLDELRDRWMIDSLDASWLVITVQLGFVAGATLSAYTGLADRLRPQRLVLIGALGAALANGMVVVTDSYYGALGCRFVTGAFLALVYPPAMKAMSGWFATGRGVALGTMVGALTIGSALPHLVNALGGFSWEPTLLIISALTVAGGLMIDRLGAPGPHLGAPQRFDPTRIRSLVAVRSFRLATLGYFGHMWELYAMWAWIAVFAADVIDSDQGSSVFAFVVIGIGAAGSVHAGRISDTRGRAVAARWALSSSAAMALVVGFVADAPLMVVLVPALVWGYSVVADSAQFSTIVSEQVPAETVGTALTVQLASGFVLSVATIFLVPWVRDAAGWGWAFAMLAPGPIIGVWAMRQLEAQPGWSAPAGRTGR